jgi:hypothetical protein
MGIVLFDADPQQCVTSLRAPSLHIEWCDDCRPLWLKRKHECSAGPKSNKGQFGHREDAIDIGWRAPKQIDAINPVGNQAAGGTMKR